MDVTTVDDHPSDPHAHDPHPHDTEVPYGWRWSVPRAFGVGGFLAMAIFWIWAFNNADSVPHADEFDDPSFVAKAETLCAARQDTIRALPNATTAKNAEERAVLVDAGTHELAQMVAELGSLAPPVDPKGADGVKQWLGDYELYLNDRRVYADILATGEDPQFLISGNAQDVRVTDLLTTFAEVNLMASCGPSGDV